MIRERKYLILPKKLSRSLGRMAVLFSIVASYPAGLSAQAPDSLPSAGPANAPAEKSLSAIELEFVKSKVQYSPDSIFFNVLKVSNNNGKPVQGTVKISVPVGWKIISQEETPVNIQPGASEYIPVRVSLARTVSGGVTYLVNATLVSERSLFANKNQTSVTKSCYVTIPKKGKWDVSPVLHTVYFNRYMDYTPMQLLVSNKGNGNEIIKLELEIGSSLELYGSLGKRYFTSVELKPHRDTVLSFPMKYIPPDESIIWSRDFRSLTVKIAATVDTVVKRTSVSFKYLESIYYNRLAEEIYPLNIEVQLQNLLSDVPPRLFVGADGTIYFKNEHTLDYYARFSSIALSGYKSPEAFAERIFWAQSRFRAHYYAGKWEAIGGDIGGTGISMIAMGGRGIGGLYRINQKQKISGALTAGVNGSVYSGNIQHEIQLPKRIDLTSALAFTINNYNKMNTFGAALKASYPFYPGHRVSLLVSGSQTQHLYDNQTFSTPTGGFVTTNDPSATFMGVGTQLDYSMNLRRARATISSRYTTKHFSQYFNGRIWVHGTGQYIINKKYYLIAGINFTQQDPQIYHRGILSPQNFFSYGKYNLDLATKINPRLLLFTGPVFDHSDHRQLKILPPNDSIHTRFSVMSTKWSTRLSLKSGAYSSLSLYAIFGYTYIMRIEDPTLYFLSIHSKNPYFNTNTGVNVTRKNWGVNVTYYTGAYNLAMESDYYFLGSYNKTIRIMPYFQRYFFDRKILLVSNNSYFYQTRSNMESVSLNARLSFFFDKGWTLLVDNNLYMNSRISNEGIRHFSKMYGLNIGFRKSFDIPQPYVKYHDLRIIAFKDINGNGTMDANEYGLPDIVINVDRESKSDSVTKKPLKLKGQFSPAEMVTDNFGQAVYYHIPEGDFNISVYPLMNLKDVYNVKGQKQNIKISSDTTYYIPFVQSFRVVGHVILKRDEYSSLGSISVANIRITATDSLGNSFPSLTSGDGSYVLYVPQAGEYKVTITNVFENQFSLQNPEYMVSFDGAKEFLVDFIFNEKKRQINMNGAGTGSAPAPSGTGSSGPSPLPASPPAPGNAPKDTSSSTGQNPAPTTEAGVTFRVQIGSSAKKIAKSQYATMFKGADKIQEYTLNGAYKYTAGEFSTWEFEKATAYKDELIAKGYKDAFIVFFKNGKRIK